VVSLRLPGRPVTFSRKILWAGLLAGFLSLFSGSPLSLDGVDLLPVLHFVNVVSGLVLGPWFALGIAVFGSGIRMGFFGATLFALPTALPGGVSVGLARKYLPSRFRWTAGLFEPVGTLLGASLGYALVAVGALSSRVPVLTSLGFFFLSSSIGALVGFGLIWTTTLYRRRTLVTLRLKPMLMLTALTLSFFLQTMSVQGYSNCCGFTMGPPVISVDLLGSGSRFGNTTAFLEGATSVYRNGTTFYGHPGSLFFLHGLITELSPELQCSGCPYYMTNAWIAVSFTNSSGSVEYFSTNQIAVSADPGGSAGYGQGQPQSPSLKIGNSNLPSAEWINIRTDRRISTMTLDLSYTIPFGDAFKGSFIVTVTNHAEVWENLDSFLIRDAVATSTYSFVYIVM
jgi:energy coupling factor transporter S component ThiW